MKKKFQFIRKMLTIMSMILFGCAPLLATAQNYEVYQGAADGILLGTKTLLKDAVNLCIPNIPCTVVATENDYNVSAGVDNYITIPQSLIITLTSEVGELDSIFQPNQAWHILVEGNLTLKNIVLVGHGYSWKNIVTVTNGGVKVEATGKLTMESGAVIRDCFKHFHDGSGVFTAGEFTMNGGAITNNTSLYWGGGVCVGKTGSFTMNGGEISENTGRVGGGLCVYTNSGNVVIKGEISGNSAFYGGGIYTRSALALSGNVRNNKAILAGGLMMENKKLCDLTGGEISNNEALLGGGVLVTDNDLTLKGTKIINNSATIALSEEIVEMLLKMTGTVINEEEDIKLFLASQNYHFEQTGDGGGVYLHHNITYDTASLIMTAGAIANNTAARNGGGIYTVNYNYNNPAAAYYNINIVENDSVYGNQADRSYDVPGISGWNKDFDINLLNNDQINYIDPYVDIKTVCAGDSVVIEALVEEVSGISYTYQWYLNDQLLSGETNPTYTIYNPADGDNVYCWVTSVTDCPDSVKTNTITINVTNPPTLTSLGTAPTICSGEAVLYTAEAGELDVTFTWTRAAVSGIMQPANSGTGATINETLTNSTNQLIEVTYIITMTNTKGCFTSKNVTVKVKPKVPVSAIIRIKN